MGNYFRSRAVNICLAGHIAVKKAPFKLKKSLFAGRMLPPPALNDSLRVSNFFFQNLSFEIDSQCCFTWASADFFSEEGKIFQGRGKRYYLLKTNIKKDTIFLKMSKTYHFWLVQGESRDTLAPPPPHLRTLIKL